MFILYNLETSDFCFFLRLGFSFFHVRHKTSLTCFSTLRGIRSQVYEFTVNHSSLDDMLLINNIRYEFLVKIQRAVL